MILLVLVLLLSSLAAASQVDFPICPDNLYGQYYIVFGPSPPPSKAAAQPPQRRGMPFDLYSTACEAWGLRPANITHNIVTDLVNLLNRCVPVIIDKNAKRTKQEDPEHALWIDYYEGLPKPADCNSLFDDGAVFSVPFLCLVYNLPALCQMPVNPIEVISITVTESETVTEDATSVITTVLVSTETITDYVVTSVITVVTRGTSTITTITTTSTSCSTKTRTHTITPTCDCGVKIQKNVSDWKSTKVVKVPAVPDQAQQAYIQCTDSVNDFYLVRANAPAVGAKSNSAAHINGDEACGYLGMQLANVTMPILDNLGTMFDSCLSYFDSFVFNSYYAWTPLCGYSYYYGVDFIGIGINDVNPAQCENAPWALCRLGPAIIVTSTVTTGPFTTVTLEISRTETVVVTESGSILETVTESDISIVTSTSFFPVTLTSSATVATNTVTSTSTSITSCCCNSVVCTTVEVCCTPMCQKPGSNHEH